MRRACLYQDALEILRTFQALAAETGTDADLARKIRRATVNLA
jgi:hypothetical protein